MGRAQGAVAKKLINRDCSKRFDEENRRASDAGAACIMTKGKQPHALFAFRAVTTFRTVLAIFSKLYLIRHITFFTANTLDRRRALV